MNPIIELYRSLSNTPYGVYRFIYQYCHRHSIFKNNDLKSFIINSISMMFNNTFFSIYVWPVYPTPNGSEDNNMLRKSIGTIISNIQDSDEFEQKLYNALDEHHNSVSYMLDGFIYLNSCNELSIPLNVLNHKELTLLFQIISKNKRDEIFNIVEVSGNRLICKDCKLNREITEKYEDCFYMIEFFIFSLIYYTGYMDIANSNHNEIICAKIRSLCDIIISSMNNIRYIETKYQQRYNNLINWLSNSNTIEIIKLVFEWGNKNIIPFSTFV